MAWLGQVGHHEGDRGVFANNIHLAVELRLLGLKIGQRLGRLSVHALNPQHKSFLLLGVRPLVRRLATQTTPHRIRQILLAHILRLRFPDGKRERWILARITGHHGAGFIPVRLAVKMGVGPTVDIRARLKSNLLGIHFQANPFAGLRKIAHAAATCRAILAPRDFVFSPVSPLFPIAGVKLQHDLLGRIKSVEVHVGKQLHAFLHDQRRVGAADDELF